MKAFDDNDPRVQEAFMHIKMAHRLSMQYYGEPVSVCYSGGKDSDVLLDLYLRSGVPFKLNHSLTTVDAPPTVEHVYEVFDRLKSEGIETEVDKHVQEDGRRTTMWNLIARHTMPPTRIVRYCCKELKESFSTEKFIATGVRRAESVKRSGRGIFHDTKKRIPFNAVSETMLSNDNTENRLMIERCMTKSAMSVNPIVEWSDKDVIEYAHDRGLKLCELYKMGYWRVGCVGCPMATGDRERDFRNFPTYKRAYIRAFDKMLDAYREKRKDTVWKSGKDVFRWWMEDKNIEGQMSFDIAGNLKEWDDE